MYPQQKESDKHGAALRWLYSAWRMLIRKSIAHIEIHNTSSEQYPLGRWTERISPSGAETATAEITRTAIHGEFLVALTGSRRDGTPLWTAAPAIQALTDTLEGTAEGWKVCGNQLTFAYDVRPDVSGEHPLYMQWVGLADRVTRQMTADPSAFTPDSDDAVRVRYGIQMGDTVASGTLEVRRYPRNGDFALAFSTDGFPWDPDEAIECLERHLTWGRNLMYTGTHLTADIVVEQ